ncbi:MAG TPA: family 10 glycosylhydrolase [Blastocatellia bacterium]|nr:family 10 glycosylhydrolase [Blastocatellia bacterium]
MRRAVTIITAYLLLLLSAFLPAQKTGAPTPTLPSPHQVAAALAKATPQAQQEEYPFREVRALWVVRDTMTSPQSVLEMVRRAKEDGFTDLIVQVRGRGDAYYNSRLEPRADDLANQPADFDPLAVTLSEAHRIGMRVHAWINIYLVANIEKMPRSQSHLIYQHPEWLMVPRGLAAELYNVNPKSPEYLERLIEFTRGNRTELEGLYASPAHPEVNENLLKIWLDVAERYEVDGLHFDYVRYPNPSFDFSRVSLDRFRQELEKNLTADDRNFFEAQASSDPLIHATNFQERYAKFQRQQVTELVERVYKGVKQIKPHAIVSAAVFANTDEAARSKFQDWRQWARMGWLDVVCPMSYTPETETFRKLITNAVSQASGKQIWAGIGAFKQTADRAAEKIQATRELGAQGFVLFSYDSSVKASPDLNPQGDYLERVREVWRPSHAATTPVLLSR